MDRIGQLSAMISSSVSIIAQRYYASQIERLVKYIIPFESATRAL
jgi:hypothetical protein